MSRVAFVGLGRMGSGMAARLVQAGHEVCLYNRTASRAGPLIAIGARRFDSPREACDRADAVVAMVSDDAASEAVWLGPEGILAANLESGASVIECSTLSYDWVMRLNLLGAVQIASAAETMALAEKAGLDLETVPLHEGKRRALRSFASRVESPRTSMPILTSPRSCD